MSRYPNNNRSLTSPSPGTVQSQKPDELSCAEDPLKAIPTRTSLITISGHCLPMIDVCAAKIF